MCFSACHWARIDTIIYGAGIEDAQDSGFNELAISNNQLKELGESSVGIIPDFLREESVELFHMWLQQEDRKVY